MSAIVTLDTYIMLTLGSVQGSLEAPATCKNGHLVNKEVSEACFSCFFQWDINKSILLLFILFPNLFVQ